jgi:TPR repeat protein
MFQPLEEKSKSQDQLQDLSCDMQKLKLSAEQGNANAQALLGRNYLYGWQTDKNQKEGEKWLMLATKQDDNAPRIWAQGVCYAEGINDFVKSPPKAFTCYQRASEIGYAPAQCSLAECYETQFGMDADESVGMSVHRLAETIRLYRLAAKQGYAAAQCKLAACYLFGKGVKKNKIEAVKLFILAAEQGLAAAQCNLGWCYDKGIGVNKSGKDAIKFYRLAAEQGNVYAQHNLGTCYKEGREGVMKDKREAINWYRLAAQHGHAAAQEALSKLLLSSAVLSSQGLFAHAAQSSSSSVNDSTMSFLPSSSS